MLDDFAVFILSHGRPDKVHTLNSLRKSGYTGRWFIVIDNEDKTASKYYENFGDKVIMFDKAAIAETFDEGDNFGDRRAVIYARNACFDIARELGIKYFMELDDDYYSWCYKTDNNLDLRHEREIRNIDNIFMSMLDYYKNISFIKSFAMAQGGDFIGGENNILHKSINLRRKCMNSFICSIDRDFRFVGRVNEDVNTYTWYQSLGNLFMTFPLIMLHQKQTQNNSGGMTEMYLDSGTYIKSFYTVMYQPSSVTIMTMGEKKKRLHHRINWNCTAPVILSEKYKKKTPVIVE